MPLSPQRFKNIECTSSSISALVVGSPGEILAVTALTASGPELALTVEVKRVKIPGSGELEIQI